MEELNDLTWMRQLVEGKTIERFVHGAFSVVALRSTLEDLHHPVQFVYRILFFPGKNSRPVLSLNLEASILGEYYLTEHRGKKHASLGRVEEQMTYEDFRRWALKRADSELAATAAK